MTIADFLAYVSTVLHLVAFGAVVWLWVKQIEIMGPWHGLLGFVTCFFYPFIWGCVKAKELKLTRIVEVAAITSLLGLLCALPSLFIKIREMQVMMHQMLGLPPPP